MLLYIYIYIYASTEFTTLPSGLENREWALIRVQMRGRSEGVQGRGQNGGGGGGNFHYLAIHIQYNQRTSCFWKKKNVGEINISSLFFNTDIFCNQPQRV